MSFGERLSKGWYSNERWPLLLVPLSRLASVIINRRRHRFLTNGPYWVSPVPLIVVGNITVGGTGKTPLVQSLVSHLKSWGYHPGIISRGYGGSSKKYPLAVKIDTPASECGDEPLMLAQTTGCPVYVDPDRCSAAQQLIKHEQVDVIVSDDGLQHYRMGRDIEIVVIDGERGVGNGQLLPAGPLREPVSRLGSVDYVVINGVSNFPEFLEYDCMSLIPKALVNLVDGREVQPGNISSEFTGQTVRAIAGIGNPTRFFNSLKALGLNIDAQAFEDHHAYSKTDIEYNGPVIMTEKDAVKCYPLATTEHWYLKIGAQLPEELFCNLRDQLQRLSGDE